MRELIVAHGYAVLIALCALAVAEALKGGRNG